MFALNSHKEQDWFSRWTCVSQSIQSQATKATREESFRKREGVRDWGSGIVENHFFTGYIGVYRNLMANRVPAMREKITCRVLQFICELKQEKLVLLQARIFVNDSAEPSCQWLGTECEKAVRILRATASNSQD